MLKIGLFFGSFNPIHLGHLIIANYMAEYTDLDRIWFVVSPQNPFKKSHTLLHEFDRLEMVRMAIDDNPSFAVSDIEFRMPRPSYTIDTLTYLSAEHSLYKFSLIIGEDNLENFPKWKNAEKILEYYPIYVYPRPRVVHSSLKNDPRILHVEAPLIDISATSIRRAVKEDKSIRYLVPDNVLEYIKTKSFFVD